MKCGLEALGSTVLYCTTLCTILYFTVYYTTLYIVNIVVYCSVLCCEILYTALHLLYNDNREAFLSYSIYPESLDKEQKYVESENLPKNTYKGKLDLYKLSSDPVWAIDKYEQETNNVKNWELECESVGISKKICDDLFLEKDAMKVCDLEEPKKGCHRVNFYCD